MDAKFTPGPWSFVPSIPEEGVECFWIENGVMRITGIDGPQTEAQEANARASDHENLVGELVGTLKDLVEAVRPYVYPTPDKPKSLWAKVEQARELIAKAEAQQ